MRRSPTPPSPRIYDIALVTRAVDERLWILTRQGRAGFVLTARGHEIAEIASALTMRGARLRWLYYRDPASASRSVSRRTALPRRAAHGRPAQRRPPADRAPLRATRSASAASRARSVRTSPRGRRRVRRRDVKGEDSVAVCYFGDGAASEGGTHEAMNLAGVHKLPVVFLCENNGYAISVPLAQQMPITSLEQRAEAYGFAGATVDGCDAEAVHEGNDDSDRTSPRPTKARLSSTCNVPASSRTPRRTTTRTATPTEARAAAHDPIPACAPPRRARRARPRGRTRSRARRSRPRCSPPPTRRSRNLSPPPIEPASICTLRREWLSSASSRRSARRSTRRWRATTQSSSSARTSA